MLKESYLKEYPVTVVNNTIDLKIFRKLDKEDEGLKEIHLKYAIDNKKILLGVSNVWDRRKGLEDLIKLSCLAGENYRTIIIGVSEKQIEELHNIIDRCYKELVSETEVTNNKKMLNLDAITLKSEKGIATKPGAENLYKGLIEITGEERNKTSNPEIIAMPHTKDQEELVRFYNLADVFINPTHEDNYPTVNLEAIACGTKVLTTDAGGSAETI